MLNVKVYRGNNIESRHQVLAAVVNSQGQVLESYGDIETLIYPRSAIKPLQALPLVVSGASDFYHLTDQEIAIASSSHDGEEFHIECVESWLARLNLSIKDLECGVHPPYHDPTAFELYKQGKEFLAIHNNCSGKHTGMLCLAQFLKVPTQGYVKAHHPVQQKVKEQIEQMIQYKIPAEAFGIDGCSIPTWWLPLKNFAGGLARFADPTSCKDLDSKVQKACQRVYEACVQNPDYIAGTERFCTKIMKECEGKAVVKTGAEGVFAAMIREQGLGIAVKCLDGSLRGSEAAIAYLLNKYQVLPNHSGYLHKKVSNWNHIVTSRIEVSI
jgi:L-asparaginase II